MFPSFHRLFSDGLPYMVSTKIIFIRTFYSVEQGLQATLFIFSLACIYTYMYIDNLQNNRLNPKRIRHI